MKWNYVAEIEGSVYKYLKDWDNMLRILNWPEAPHSDPSPLEPDRGEEWGQGDDVDDGGEGKEEMVEGVRRQEPQEGVEDKDDGEGKVNLDGEPLVPRHTLFHQTWP